jgi:hypothetical protein
MFAPKLSSLSHTHTGKAAKHLTCPPRTGGATLRRLLRAGTTAPPARPRPGPSAPVAFRETPDLYIEGFVCERS